MYFRRRYSFSLLFLCTSLLAGCDRASQIKESMVHARPIEAEMEKAVGKRPKVFSAETAGILVVTVQFSEIPEIPVASIEKIARAAVVHEFKTEPTMLSISFVFNKLPFQP